MYVDHRKKSSNPKLWESLSLCLVYFLRNHFESLSFLIVVSSFSLTFEIMFSWLFKWDVRELSAPDRAVIQLYHYLRVAFPNAPYKGHSVSLTGAAVKQPRRKGDGTAGFYCQWMLLRCSVQPCRGRKWCTKYDLPARKVLFSSKLAGMSVTTVLQHQVWFSGHLFCN